MTFELPKYVEIGPWEPSPWYLFWKPSRRKISLTPERKQEAEARLGYSIDGYVWEYDT